jgi:hypothetical protein
LQALSWRQMADMPLLQVERLVRHGENSALRLLQ